MFSNQMLPLWYALFGGLLSVGGSMTLAWFTKKSERKHEAAQLARAFRGEIMGSISIVEVRRYSEVLRQLAAHCRAHNDAALFSLASREDYRAVYRANAGKLGLLPPKIAESIAVLYTHSASVQEDFKTMDEEFCGTRKVSSIYTPVAMADRYDQLADLLDDTVGKARAVVAAVDACYPDESRHAN
ncbi:MAG TPA: hypothetical protein PK060_15450 [Polaromonas sp.]|jgi:hypothetical protein|uniref:hypothetical protein n=1 Tax=unclassified Polaromonas TaxID=2638319 RepID=UPI000BDD13B4|nr:MULTISPECIES: hypothetical protein [unclassified Polaromonas]OYZ18588.1 MAG: hypothetical protein B7Y28_16320 [Polaromonas sp. 16-63-31]HQS65447.1 hypothetical protein [Acidovorax defluvii]HQT08607.1 hypothetical protein [Polaromonas sp.]